MLQWRAGAWADVSPTIVVSVSFDGVSETSPGSAVVVGSISESLGLGALLLVDHRGVWSTD